MVRRRVSAVSNHRAIDGTAFVFSDLCVSPRGIFPRLPSKPRRARKPLGKNDETPAENELTIKGKAYIAGIYEHPTRHAPDKSTSQLHAEVAKGAIEDAGLTKADIDGYFCAGDAPGGIMNMVDYLGLDMNKRGS